MKYAVLGTGMVGNTLATKLITLGHEVCMAARSAENETALAWAAEQGDRAGANSFQAAAAWADRLILAVKGAVVLDVVATLDDALLKGKTVIDVTNPLDSAQGFPPPLIAELSNTTSAGEAVQAALPSAHVVKTLNTMNHHVMVDPSRVPGRHDVFLCGDHDAGKAAAAEMLVEFGWTDPIDLGPMSSARGTEGLMLFWLRMMKVVGGTDFNYAIARK